MSRPGKPRILEHEYGCIKVTITLEIGSALFIKGEPVCTIARFPTRKDPWLILSRCTNSEQILMHMDSLWENIDWKKTIKEVCL